jgi:Cu/Ag efflux protein CusF
MKKAVAIALSVIFAIALTGVSFATEKKAAAHVKITEKHVTGEVAGVDANAKEITVKEKKGDIKIFVDDKTKIMSGKDAKALGDIKTGETVYVKYADAGGRNTAKSIDIHTASAKKK